MRAGTHAEPTVELGSIRGRFVTTGRLEAAGAGEPEPGSSISMTVLPPTERSLWPDPIDPALPRSPTSGAFSGTSSSKENRSSIATPNANEIVSTSL